MSPPDADVDSPMLSRLADLWAGRLPLRQAFWDYAIFWGILVNLAATMLSLALLVVAGAITDGGGHSWPSLLALVVHFLPTPYNVCVVVGVWRSAGRPGTPDVEALLARAAVSVGGLLMFLV